VLSVLIVNWSGHYGGVEKHLLMLAGGLDPQKYRLIFASPDNGPFPAMLREAGYRWYNVPMRAGLDSESVRRLVRDGVDVPLADLFVHAARRFAPTVEGDTRARSATEAFLFRRLETLPETAGRFRLNDRLPIPFDGGGEMEVDLLDADARLAVELDGPQHLADADAYRRDRRKDALLQENGYFVLRFLTEDVGKQLDHVLDTLLHFIVRRGRK